MDEGWVNVSMLRGDTKTGKYLHLERSWNELDLINEVVELLSSWIWELRVQHWWRWEA